ncbi:MAG: hypothetical protein RI928_2036 [Pseudomonadota bacterium]
MSESPQTARRRHEYLPNRMFDPVANPFAVQNLLVKEEQGFTVDADGRPEFGFESDPLISKEGPGIFALDEVIELADLTGATAFASETNAENAFVTDPSSVAGDAATAMQEPEFMADAAMASQNTEGFTEHTEQGETIATAQSQDDSIAMTEADAEALSDTDAASLATSTKVAEENTVAAEEIISASADEQPVETPELAIEPEAEQVSAVPVEAVAPAAPDLSSEAVTALVEAAREQARAETREIAYNEGLEAGKAQAKAALQKEHEEQITQLKALQEALKKLSFDADALFEPVKKLTVHLAEQLVRGELAQSPQTISRLVDNSLRELNASGEKAVIVHLNPEDLEAYRPLVAQFGDSMILRPDSLLERGSVRVSLDGSVVEDLMQRRVDGLKKSLSQPAAPAWQAGGGRLSDRLNESQRGSQHVEDVTAVETSSSDDDSND